MHISISRSWPSVAVTLMLASLLAGCATAAQRQYQAMSTGNQAIMTQGKACLEAAYNSPDAAPVRAHEPFNVADASLSQLADASLATKPEIDSIMTIHPQLRACQKIALDAMLNTTPSVVPLLAKAYSEADDDILLLIKRKLSWGEYTKRRRDRSLAGQVAIQAESQRITAGLEQQHESELGRRQAALNAISQWAQTQQMINAMNRPVMTNCFGAGSMISCTTH